MKTLAVLGCSFSTGEETCDNELYENYVGFDGKMVPENKNLKAVKHREFMWDRKFDMIPKWYEDNKRMIDEWRQDPIFPDRPSKPEYNQGSWNNGKGFRELHAYWDFYNDKNTYSNILHKSLTDYNVVNMSKRGTGLNYQHFIYNMHRQIKSFNSQKKWLTDVDRYIVELEHKKSWLMKAYYPELYTAPDEESNWNYFNEVNWHGEEQPEDFRYDKMIDNADVLIWQMTGEPRYAITLRGSTDLGLGANLQNLTDWFDHQKKSGFWKNLNINIDIEFMKDYYKYYHNPSTDIAATVGWMENVLKLREIKKLKTILLLPTSQAIERFGIIPKNTEYTKWIGFEKNEVPMKDPYDEGHTWDWINLGLEDIRGNPSYKAKWGHLSKEGHNFIAKLLKETLEKWQ